MPGLLYTTFDIRVIFPNQWEATLLLYPIIVAAIGKVTMLGIRMMGIKTGSVECTSIL